MLKNASLKFEQISIKCDLEKIEKIYNFIYKIKSDFVISILIRKYNFLRSVHDLNDVSDFVRSFISIRLFY